MMLAVNLSTEVLAQRTADEYVGGKMLLPGDTGDADCGGCTISKELGHGPGIFVGQDAGYRPCGRSMVRRKGCSSLPELPFTISFSRTLPSSEHLDRRTHCETIDESLAAQQSGLPCMVVVSNLAQEVKPACRPNQRSRPKVGELLAPFDAS